MSAACIHQLLSCIEQPCSCEVHAVQQYVLLGIDADASFAWAPPHMLRNKNHAAARSGRGRAESMSLTDAGAPAACRFASMCRIA